MPAAIAKVFTRGKSQSVCLPKGFLLDGDEVFMRQSGNSLILTPCKNSWKGFVEGFRGLIDDFSVMDGVSEDAPRKTLL